jgi:hypothetical protein
MMINASLRFRARVGVISARWRLLNLKKLSWSIVLFAGVALGFQNCSSGGSSSSSSNGTQSIAGNSVISASELAGTWGPTTCTVSGNSSYQMTFEYTTQGMFAFVSPFYLGNACSGAPLFTLQLNGSLTLGSLDATVAGATDVTYTFEPDAEIIIDNVSAASALNQTQFCGLSNWQVNSPKFLPTTSACLNSVPMPPGNTILAIASNVLYSGTTDLTAIDFTLGLAYEGATTPDVLAALTLGPSAAVVAPNSSVQLLASGGVPPYTFSLIGTGTISSSGVFKAPASNGTTTVSVTDDAANKTSLVIQIGPVNFAGLFVGTETGSQYGQQFTQPVNIDLTQSGSAISGTFDFGNGNAGSISGTAGGNQITSFKMINSTTNPCGAGTYTGTASVVGTSFTASFQGSSSLCGPTAGAISAAVSSNNTQAQSPASASLPGTLWVSNCTPSAIAGEYVRTTMLYSNGNSTGTALYDIQIYSAPGCVTGSSNVGAFVTLYDNAGTVSSSVTNASNITFAPMVCEQDINGTITQTQGTIACLSNLGIPSNLLAPLTSSIFSINNSTMYFGTTSLDQTTPFTLTGVNPL